MNVLVAHLLGVKSRHREGCAEFVHILAKGLAVGIIGDCFHEVLKFRSALFLDLNSQVETAHQKLSDFTPVRLNGHAGGEGGGTNADASRRDRAAIPLNSVLVQCNVTAVTDLLELGPSYPLGL